MYFRAAALVAVASCTSIVQAQGLASDTAIRSPVRSLSLDDALTAALRRSPSVDAASAELRAASAGRTIAGLRPNPELSVEAENVGGTGEFRGTRSAEVTTGLALPIELGGKRSARIGLADAQIGVAQLERAIATADLREKLVASYAAVLASDRRLEIATREADFAATGHRAASARVTAGAASPIEQQRAQVLRINADLAVDKARRGAANARANLERMTGLGIAGPLDAQWFERIDGAGPAEPVSVEETLAFAAAEANLSTASAQVRLARAQRVPDITLSAGARRLSATNDTAAVLGVSIPFPLFNGGSAAVDQALAQESVAQAHKRLALLQTEQEIAEAQAALSDAAATARAAGGPAMNAALEAARIAELGYANGKFSQLDLIEAQRTLSATRANHVAALEAYHLAKARLARLLTRAPDLKNSESFQ